MALFDSDKERQRLTKKLVPRRVSFVRPADDVDSKTGQGIPVPDLAEFACDILGQDPSLPVRCSHDAVHFYMRNARTGKLLLAVPKISNEFFLEIAEFFIGPIVTGTRPPGVNGGAVIATVERWQRLRNVRIVAKQRFRRNNKAERRRHNDIAAALAERQRWRMAVESAAHYLNELAKRDPDVRDQAMAHQWNGGLLVPKLSSHIIPRSWHAHTPKKRAP